MKLYLRLIGSLIVTVLAYAVIDYYFDGLFKYSLWGITTAVVGLYNEKKNREYKKSTESL